MTRRKMTAAQLVSVKFIFHGKPMRFGNPWASRQVPSGVVCSSG